MTATVGPWNVAMVCGVIAIIAVAVGWISLLVYYDSQNIHFRLRGPWTVLMRYRRNVERRRARVEELELQVQEEELRHTVRQRQMVNEDLEHNRLQRALERGKEEAG